MSITSEQLVSVITGLKHRPIMGKLTMTIVESIELTPIDTFATELEDAIAKHSTGRLLNKLDMQEIDRLRMINHSKRILQQPWPKHLHAIQHREYNLTHIDAPQRVIDDIQLAKEQDQIAGYCVIL